MFDDCERGHPSRYRRIPKTITVANSALGLFTANLNGSGPLSAQVVSVAPGGAQTYSDTAMLNGTTYVDVPIVFAPAGDSFYLLLYGTGFDNGEVITGTINGQTFRPIYAGPHGAFAGLDQIDYCCGRAWRDRVRRVYHHRGRSNLQRGNAVVQLRRGDGSANFIIASPSCFKLS